MDLKKRDLSGEGRPDERGPTQAASLWGWGGFLWGIATFLWGGDGRGGTGGCGTGGRGAVEGWRRKRRASAVGGSISLRSGGGYLLHGDRVFQRKRTI